MSFFFRAQHSVVYPKLQMLELLSLWECGTFKCYIMQWGVEVYRSAHLSFTKVYRPTLLALRGVSNFLIKALRNT